MKVSIDSNSSRKLVAVIGAGGDGLFLPSACGNSSRYINEFGGTGPSNQLGPLTSMLAANSHRTPVYEGDRVTLTF